MRTPSRIFFILMICLMPAMLSAQTQPSPSAPESYYVVGEVSHRGIYLFPKDGKVTALDALAAAGGPTPLANMNGAKIQRVVGGKVILIDVHFDKLQKKAMQEYNLPILPGDVLFVPQRGRIKFLAAPLGPFAWADLRGLRFSFFP